MAIGYLNERTRKMIDMIAKSGSALSMKQIAEELSVSTRTVYNELEKANDWLHGRKLHEITVIRGKVQPFEREQKEELEAAVALDQEQQDYIFTPSERTKIIVCQIMISKEPVYVDDLMDTCCVSRNTIFADLQAVISQLHAYQLGIGYEKKRGYWITGDPIRSRAIFFLYFNRLEPLVSAGKLHFFDKEGLQEALKKIEAIERELKVSYVRNDMIALAAMIPVMEQGRDELYFPDVSVHKVEDSKEYEMVERFFPELSEMEKDYLTLHFLGGRLASYSKDEPGEEIDETVLEIAKNLVTEFERRACVSFEQKDELIRNLYRHIASSIYRYRFGIQIGNPMAEDIKREYPYIFDMVRMTSRYLEQQIGVQISDSEVAYLALHFGAHMDYAKHNEKNLRILVVCMNGVATGNMISHELRRILPQATIVGIMAASQIVNPQQFCDIIISSVPIKAGVPVIIVNPILNDFDRKNILTHPLIRSRAGFVDFDALYQLVKKYVAPEQHAQLHHDLETFFAQNLEEKQPVLKPDMWRMTDFLTDDRIVFLDVNGCAKEHGEVKGHTVAERALFSTAAPLLARGSISELYVTDIIERLKEAGPYMFVTKDLILAHARPDCGVKHLDLAIGIAPHGIPFAEGKTARVIFLLVVEDQQKHMGILQDIRKVLAKEKQIDALMQLTEEHEVCEHLWNGLQ